MKLSQMKNIFGIFRKRQIDYKKIFIDFNKSLKLISDKSALINSSITRINELVASDHVYFFMLNTDTNHYELDETTLGKINDTKVYFAPNDGLIKWISLNEKYLLISYQPEFASIYSSNDLHVLGLASAHIVFPVKVMNVLKGVVVLGKPKNKNIDYTQDNLEMITILLDNAALAIENLSFFEEQKERLKKMYRADKLAVIGQLAAGAAHEIRNPLTSIRSIIQYVQPSIRNLEKKRMVDNALNEVDRINNIIKGMLSFSRQTEPSMEQFDLKDLLEQTLSLIKNTLLKKNIVIDFEFIAPHSSIIADNAQIKQVMLNIILNAIEAIEENGTINILVTYNDVDKKEMFDISIKDNGKGISSDHIEKIFDPFFTTKNDGTGLGLSICYGIIHKHHGEIEIKSIADKGTEVKITLPVISN